MNIVKPCDKKSVDHLFYRFAKLFFALIVFVATWTQTASFNQTFAGCNDNSCGMTAFDVSKSSYYCNVGKDKCTESFKICDFGHTRKNVKCCVGPDRNDLCKIIATPTPTPKPIKNCEVDLCGKLIYNQAAFSWLCDVGGIRCGASKFKSCSDEEVAGGICCIGSKKDGSCKNPPQPPINNGTTKPYAICDQIPNTQALAQMRSSCMECVGKDDGYGGIWTAIGCIPRDPDTIVSVFLRFGLGMGGGVALLMILGSGFMLSVSQGDPKQTDTAKQWLTSAIAGLLFIIFSVTILQFIGYNIFQIPGFGG